MIDFNYLGFESSASTGSQWLPRVSFEQPLLKTRTLQGDTWRKVSQRFMNATTNRAWEENEMQKKINMEDKEKIHQRQRERLLELFIKSNGSSEIQHEDRVLAKKKRARRREKNLECKARGRE